jgi:phosphomannomutase
LDSRPARTVQQTKLDAGAVNDAAHNAAESVYLSDNMAFSDPTDSRIARHLPDKVQIDRNKSRLDAQTRRGRGRLAPGMPRAYYNHIKSLVEHLNFLKAEKWNFLVTMPPINSKVRVKGEYRSIKYFTHSD